MRAHPRNVLTLLDQVRPTHPHRQDTLMIYADRCAACSVDQVLTIDD
jgi:hypothetical protein